MASRPSVIEAGAHLVQELQRRGYRALFAGGCVRDRLLGKVPKDVDIATDALPEAVQAIFPRTVPVGVQFGVVRVLESGYEFEVATFRADSAYVDGRHPESVRFSSAEEDASRRDFTVNGLFLDPVTNRVLDFVGGQADLAAGVIRAIGDPKQRFAEDRLRLLRAVRFAATLEFEIDPATWTALKEVAGGILVVSPERIRDELLKILKDRHRVRGLDLLSDSGLLQATLPEVEALKGCEQPPQFHPEGDVFVHTRKMLELLPDDASPLLALAVLLHDIGKPPTFSLDPVDQRIRFNGHDRVGAEMALNVMRRLRFSGQETEQVVEAVRNHMVFKDVPQMRPARLRRFMARPNFPLELELHRVDCLGSFGSLDTYDFLNQKEAEFAAEPLIPPPLVSGHDLLRLGLLPGPRIGEILEAVQTAQLEGEVLGREEALKLVEKMVHDSERTESPQESK